MRKITILSVLILGMLINVSAQKNFHDFKVETLEGEPFDMQELQGKKVLVVNTASKCGLTGQYEDLQALYKKYGNDDFTIIAFPANNFLSQEPGNHEEIREFCTTNYGVTFPIMEKISVKGDDMHPVYLWLTQESENGVMDSKVSWNFQKYLIDEDGNLVSMFSPRTDPDDKEIIQWIEGE